MDCYCFNPSVHNDGDCIVLHSFPIEFANSNEELSYYGFSFWGIAIAILLTLTGTIRGNDGVAVVALKIICTMFIVFLVFIFEVDMAFSGLCTWITEEVLFEKKDDKSTEIVLRSFGCGAVDSTPPTYDVFKIKYFSSHFIWVSEIDTHKIDRSLWVRIQPSNK